MSLLSESVQVNLVTKEIGHGDNVGRKAGQAKVHGRGVVEDLGEVVGDGYGLHAETEIAGDCNAVLARHGDAGTAICDEDYELTAFFPCIGVVDSRTRDSRD